VQKFYNTTNGHEMGGDACVMDTCNGSNMSRNDKYKDRTM